MKDKGIIFIGMGFELVAMVLGALYLGAKIDESLQSQGLAVAVLLFAVMAGWFYHLVLMIKKYTANTKDL